MALRVDWIGPLCYVPRMSQKLIRSPLASRMFLVPVIVLCAVALASTRGVATGGEQAGGGPPAGRIIIPNLDDDDGDGRADFLAAVLDAAVENDLLKVRIASNGALPEGAVVKPILPPSWKRALKLLRHDPEAGRFRTVAGTLELNAEERRAGAVEIAIEAGDFAGAGRSGRFEIGFRFETRAGRLISRTDMPLEVAPFLMSCCLDPAEAVHVVRTKLTESFAGDLKPLVEAAGAKLLAYDHASVPEHDIWIQDATEIGCATDGVRTMRIALHGNRGMKLDGLFAQSFLGRDSGVVHPGDYRGKSAEWIDWFGNLEVSPPVSAGGRSFPRGRVYAGTQGARAMHPEVVRFLEAQGAQAPILWLDTSWLVIGHVDELVSWVPSAVGTPFRMIVPSPRLALEVLRRADQAAPGCVLNRGTTRPDSQKDEFCDAPVAAVLGDQALVADQARVQARIDAVRRTLQAELGVADADVVEIPVLFNSWPGRFAGRFGALTPNMVNSLQVGGTLIVADPHGPLVDGADVLLQAVKDRLEPLGCKVAAIDNFFPYHRYGGEVHCGTNATRLPGRPR